MSTPLRILLLGKNGQVGWELQRSLAVLGQVTALGSDTTEYCGDCARPSELAETVRALCPDIVSMPRPTLPWTGPRGASLSCVACSNVTAPGVLAQEAARQGAWLVHYSTDYVFDGSGSRPWVESAGPLPSTSMAAPSSKANWRCKRRVAST
jgi:dTDP-4-dehydrorhamnose reductase